MSDAAYDASRHQKKGRGKVYDSIVDTIGDTPIVGLPNLTAEYQPKARVLAKLDLNNRVQIALLTYDAGLLAEVDDVND